MTIEIREVYNEIISFAKKCNVEKIILFGSRARGNNNPKSDIDIAVYGCDDFVNFKLLIDNDLWSLLSVDLINMNDHYISKELINEIERDGVILYEKIG
ncbi:MAG: nucleotidyltransferase family protein [Clostridium sp.]